MVVIVIDVIHGSSSEIPCDGSKVTIRFCMIYATVFYRQRNVDVGHSGYASGVRSTFGSESIVVSIAI